MIPEKYQNETDYRKVPRQYLDANIPKGRGSVKWQPFATIPEQYQQLDQYMKNQNKSERPEFFEDQLDVLNEKVYWKMHSGEKAIITYWKQGYFYDHQAYIKNVDILKQSMIISNKGGNETIEIPMKDIQNIE